MQALVEVAGGNKVQDTVDLWNWLRAERGLAGAVEPIRTPPGEQELGGAVEVLAVALGSGGTGVVLARSMMTWLRTRRATVSITVKTKMGTVKVDTTNVNREDVAGLLREVLDAGRDTDA